jgi:DNA-binding response OmpR family regulator
MTPMHESEPRRILVVEDEIAIALEIEARLRDQGFDVVGPAIDAAQVGELIRSERIDGAIIDLGVVAGAVEALTEPLRAAHVPILVMTGYHPLDLPATLRSADCIVKPFAIADLLERLGPMLDAQARPAPLAVELAAPEGCICT